MLGLFDTWESGHQYTLVLLGVGKTVSKTFNSRNAANQAMYKLMGKHKLSVEKIYDDKTYICNRGAEFHINRV